MATSASSLHPSASPMQSRPVSTCCVNIQSLLKLHVRPGYCLIELIFRSRKVTSPASLSASMVSASDHLSSLRFHIRCQSGTSQCLAISREGNTSALLSSQPLSVSNSSLDTTCSTDTPQVESYFYGLYGPR